MGQSLSRQYTHIIFSTKHQQPLIIDPIEDALYSNMGAICKGEECNPLKIGGFKNHVHILCLLSRKIALMDLLKKVKANSSRWAKKQDQRLRNFAWQDGYGAFSVSPGRVDKVRAYIANQHEHHKNWTFKEEYLAFLKKYDIAYDERYLWD